MIDTQFSSKYHIYGYDTDNHCKATLTRLLSMMHETAWAHTNSLHVGWHDLQKFGQIWVITKVKLTINNLPKWNDEVTVNTCAVGRSACIYHRNYEICDNQNNLLVSAHSDWVILTQNGALVRSNPDVEAALLKTKDLTPAQPVAKLPRVNFSSELPLHQTLLSDLDMNNHVNNVSYIRWIIDSLPYNFYESHPIQEICVNYTAQLRLGDKYVIAKQEIQEFEHLYTIYTEEGKEVCRLKMIFGNKK